VKKVVDAIGMLAYPGGLYAQPGLGKIALNGNHLLGISTPELS
jgi:hypothetical protein